MRSQFFVGERRFQFCSYRRAHKSTGILFYDSRWSILNTEETLDLGVASFFGGQNLTDKTAAPGRRENVADPDHMADICPDS